MNNIPTVGPAIVFIIIVTGAHATGKFVIKRLYKIAFLIFGMKEMCFGVEEIAVIMCPVDKFLIFFFFSPLFGHLRQTPFVVCGSQCYGNGLATFKIIYLRHGFFLARVQSRNVSLLLVKFIQIACCICRPGCQRLLCDGIFAGLIGFIQVEIFQTFPVSIQKSSHDVVGVHNRPVPVDARKDRSPEMIHLFGHADERAEYVLFSFGIDHDVQRMMGAIGIPDPVVRVERRAIVIVHLAIKSTEITAIL